MESIKTSVNASQSILVSVRFKGDGVPRLGNPNKVLWGMVIDSLHESLRICRHCSLSNFFEPQRPTIRILHWPARWAVLSVSDPKVFLLCPVSFKCYLFVRSRAFSPSEPFASPLNEQAYGIGIFSLICIPVALIFQVTFRRWMWLVLLLKLLGGFFIFILNYWEWLSFIFYLKPCINRIKIQTIEHTT